MTKRDIARVNAQILNAEKRYGKDSVIVKRVYSTINKAQGTEGKTRFSLPSQDATFKDKAILQRAVDTVINSKYMSARGRREMVEKSKSKFMENHSYYSEAQIEKLYDFFENSADFDKMKELAGEGYSEQIVTSLERVIDSDVFMTQSAIDDLFNLYLKADDETRDNMFYETLDRLSRGDDLHNIVEELVKGMSQEDLDNIMDDVGEELKNVIYDIMEGENDD